MAFKINETTSADHATLLTLWEKSVRASHDFLSEDNIQTLIPLVRDAAFPNVTMVHLADDEGRPVGFLGVHDQMVEMLFIDPDFFGQGAGQQLMAYASEKFFVTKVDVNEQNPKARQFYEKLGFRVVSRSDLDGQGQPFPILHMEQRASK